MALKQELGNQPKRLARPAVEAFERIARNECPAGFQRLLFLSIVDSKSYNHRKFHDFLLNLMAVMPERGNDQTGNCWVAEKTATQPIR